MIGLWVGAMKLALIFLFHAVPHFEMHRNVSWRAGESYIFGKQSDEKNIKEENFSLELEPE